ncbi:MAG: carboxy terminal-processing peptidase [Candidatus Aminicenantes bacterium]|nr:carboxy terminal-processing peptidase [Candidatus Aminicenantes bacterium]
MKNRVFAFILLTALISAAVGAATAETREKVLSQMIGNGLANWHYSGKRIDDDFSLKSFAQYTKYLDYGKSFLIQTDLNALKVFDRKIDDEVLDGDFSLPRLGKQLLRQRVLQVRDICQEILKKPFNFSLDQQIELDADKRNYAGTLEDLKSWWFLRLKYLTLTQYLNLSKADGEKKSADKKRGDDFSPELEVRARNAVGKSVQRLFERLLQDRSEDMQALYFNALLSVFDPHSQYFPPRAKEDFDIDISGTLEGIGALLGEADGYIKVFEVIPGSPAWIQGLLKVEDIILKVGQGDDEPVDIVGMNVSDAARLVRGKKGSLVRLTVKKTDGRIMQIALIRNVVEIQETYARSAILFNEKLKKSFGYIFLPKFYHDFNRQNGRQASEDVKDELGKLAAQEVDGIILDLRNNGGGALDDAEKMAGLFIEKGPLVQLKDRSSPPQVHEDSDTHVSYGGPLVVLVNALSASASEIVAAALQDYRRAIIIGGEHTFGKGTVQVMLDLDRYLPAEMARYRPLGAITLTVQKYYRITGASTQYQGVVPDIVLPDAYSFLDVDEKSQPYSLPWDTISPLVFTPWKNSFHDLAEIKARSRQRLNSSVRFGQIAANISRLKKQREKTMVTLNLQKFQSEQDTLFQEAEKFNREQVVFPYLQARSLDTSQAEGPAAAKADLDAKRKKWTEDLRRDPALEESIQVLNDWITLAQDH